MSFTIRLPVLSIPLIFGVGFTIVIVQIIKSEKQLLNRELELKIQSNKFQLHY